MHRPAGGRGDNAFTQCVARENLSDANEPALSLSERLFVVIVRSITAITLEGYNDGEQLRHGEENICITFIPLIVEPCRLSQIVHLTINNNKLNSSTLLCSRVHGDRPRPSLGFQLFLDPPHGRRPPVVAADPGCRRTTVDEDSCVAAPEPWVPAISVPNDLRKPH